MSEKVGAIFEIYIYIAYITYKACTESPSRNMTDSITHVSGREKPPTDVIPLRAGDLCPRSSLRVSEAACTLARVRERPPLWMHAARTCTRRGPHRYGVANGEIQPATETVIPSLPSLPSRTSLLLDLRQWSSSSLFRVYLMRIEWRRGWNRARVNLKLSRPARGEILERKPYPKDPSPGSRSTYLGWRDQL